MVLNLDGELWSVVEFLHVKPGKGPAFVRTKLKAIPSGKVVSRTFNSGLKIETANIDRREMQYLYRDGTDFVFMDTSDYDQLMVGADLVGDAANYLLEGSNATLAMYEGQVLYIDMPAAVTLEITFTEPGLQGDRSNAGTKPATVETGYELQVPLFVDIGTRVRVDTRTGEYLGRATD